MAFLRKQGVRFSEQNIERNRRAFTEFQRHAGKGVPLVLIGQQKLNGFNPDKLKQALLNDPEYGVMTIITGLEKDLVRE